MRTLLTALALALLTGGGAAAQIPNAPPPREAADAPVQVRVERDGDVWTATYVLNADAPVWAFQNSALQNSADRRPWRLYQWRIETPGVVLERQGARDVVRALDGGAAPRTLTFSMRPRAVDLEADYGNLVFSDGAVALPSMQFDVFPLASVEQARALPADLNGLDLPGGPAEVTWRDRAGPVLFRGQRRASVTATDAQTYVLFGQTEVVEGPRMTTVMDLALPDWIPQALGELAPRVAEYYGRRLGPGQTDHPMVMVSWSGPTDGVTSMGGSVMPGLIVMTFEGSGVLNPTAEMRTVSRWFIGHESAHFWLGQTIRYQFARDAWITEGGADLMAVRALSALDPAFDFIAELQKAVDDCVLLAGAGPVAEAGERGDHRAYYACGAVWAMAAEGAVRERSDGDWFDFIGPLMDANRADGVLTREEWLEALTRASRDPSLRVGIERMLDQGGSDPVSEIARLFDRTGVPYRMEAGRIVL